MFPFLLRDLRASLLPPVISQLSGNVKNLSKTCHLKLFAPKRCNLPADYLPRGLSRVRKRARQYRMVPMGHLAMPLGTTKTVDPASPPRPSGRILVVEDDPAVQKAL